MSADSNSGWVRVWDPVVRFGHWILVVAFFTAYFSGDEWLAGHVWAGYAVAAVVGFRILWGFIGTRHARFADFLYSPRAILGYAGGLVTGRVKHYLGHNPLGGVMVFLLLASLLGTVTTGLVTYAYEEGAGPLAGLVQAPGGDVRREHNQGRGHNDDHDDDNEDERGEAWEEAHEVFANLTLILVAFHLLGVLGSSIAERENLVRAMFTGKKRAREPGGAGSGSGPEDEGLGARG